MRQMNEYIKRYFDGTLSEAEELRLKDFLSSPEGQAPEYSEARAVMGYFAVGKSLSRKKTNEYSRKRSRAPSGFGSPRQPAPAYS